MSRGATRVLRAGAAIVALCLTIVAAQDARAQDATNEEYALLVLANEARSDPAAFGYANAVVPPLVWNEGLARAARAHSADMAANGCYQHNSCTGQVWWKRVQSYYPHWTALAENIIAVGATPEVLHAGWMGSDGHRANILSGAMVEFGAGLAVGEGRFGPIEYGTEDFGTTALFSLRTLPAIPAAAVLPRTGTGAQRRLVTNFYDYDGPPRAVRALVGDSCVNLALKTGDPAHGTYAATRSFTGQGCVPVVFEAIKGSGTRFRFPASGAILVAVGGASCAERTATAPTQDCGGPVVEPTPVPTPAPTPGTNPTPDDESTPDEPRDTELDKVRVTLLPGPKNSSKGQVTLTATLPDLPELDPAGTPVRIRIDFASGDWMRNLPAVCGDGPCLELNKKGTAYRAQYGKSGPRLGITRDQKGSWVLRYSSRGESLGRIAPGPVTVDIEFGDLTLSGSGRGELKQNKLVAE